MRSKGLIKDENAEAEAAAAAAEAPPTTSSKSKDKKDKKGNDKGGKSKDLNNENDNEDNVNESIKWIEYDIDPVTFKYLPRIVIPKVLENSSECVNLKDKVGMEEEGGDNSSIGKNSINNEDIQNDNKISNQWISNRQLDNPFVKFWTEDQRKRSEIDRMLSESNLPTSYDKAVNEARRKGIPPPEPPTADGPYKDELMVSVFNGVNQMSNLVEKAFLGGGGNGISSTGIYDAISTLATF